MVTQVKEDHEDESAFPGSLTQQKEGYGKVEEKASPGHEPGHPFLLHNRANEEEVSFGFHPEFEGHRVQEPIGIELSNTTEEVHHPHQKGQDDKTPTWDNSTSLLGALPNIYRKTTPGW